MYTARSFSHITEEVPNDRTRLHYGEKWNHNCHNYFRKVNLQPGSLIVARRFRLKFELCREIVTNVIVTANLGHV